MANAKEEFIEHTKDKQVKCASISHDYGWKIDNKSKHILKCNYTQEEYNHFIKTLYFDYDHGYGGQEMFGTIWYNDGTWSDRGEYDGSEWWQYQSCPSIPKKLL